MSEDFQDKLASLWTTKWHDAIACGASEPQADAIATKAVNEAQRRLAPKFRR
jgi:hypothetical protein